MTMVRITIMIPDTILATIDRAVDIEYSKGRRRSEFIVRAANEKARSVIASEEASKNDGCKQEQSKTD